MRTSDRLEAVKAEATTAMKVYGCKQNRSISMRVDEFLNYMQRV
jgi:hypothetical protein